MNDIQTIQDSPAQWQPLGNVPLNQLPQKFQECFDVRKTPDLEYFMITIKTLVHWLLTTAALIWLLIMIGQAFESSTKYHELNKDLLFFNLLFAIPALFAFLVTLYFAAKKEMYRYGVETGETRIGLVIHPEALLVRIKKDSCFLMPRHWLTAVSVSSYSRGKGGQATKLVFTDIEGKDWDNILGLNAYGLFDHFDHRDTVPAALRRAYPELTVRG